MLNSRSITGRYVGLFLVGGFLFSYPVLTVFNLNFQLFGIPLFFFYIFFAWSVLIVLIFVCGKIPENLQMMAPENNDRDVRPPGSKNK